MAFKKVEFNFFTCSCGCTPETFLVTYEDSDRKSLRVECPSCHLQVQSDCLDNAYVSLYDWGVVTSAWNDVIRAKLFPEVPDA